MTENILKFKKTTKYYEDKVTIINKSLDNSMNDFEEKKKVNETFPYLVENLIREKINPFFIKGL